jgi:lipoprotein-releasing system permease protein
MNFPLFISQRIRQPESKTFSATVARIGVASIALGLTVMIVAFGVLFGFKDNIRQKLFSLSSHVRVKKFSLNESYEESPLSIQTKLYKNYTNYPEIAHLQGVAAKAGILKTKENILGIVLKGIGKDFDWSKIENDIVEGQKITLPDTQISKEILISRMVARQLKIKVGDKVLLYFLQNPPRVRPLSVAGIYETGLEEFDKALIIGDLRLIQRLNGWGKDSVGSYEIYLRNFDDFKNSVKVVYNKIDYNMGIETVHERYQQIFDWLQLLDRNLVVFVVLILFVACFNMVSILLVMMMERTPTIGLLKALGSTNWQIRKIFIYNGIWMIVRGLLIGNALGIGICAVQKYFQLIPLDPANYYMKTVPIEFNWAIIFLLNIGVLLLVSIVLILPTFIISRIEPSKALLVKK